MEELVAAVLRTMGFKAVSRRSGRIRGVDVFACLMGFGFQSQE